MTTRNRQQVRPAVNDDVAFDEALARISALATRLLRIQALHQPRRTLFGGPRCTGCRHRYPCPTMMCIRSVSPPNHFSAGKATRRWCPSRVMQARTSH